MSAHGDSVETLENRAEIARREGVTRQAVSKRLGRKVPGDRVKTGKPRPVHKVYAHDKPFKAAQKVAKKLGYELVAGENAGKGSVALMIEAIGNGQAVVMRADDYAALCGIAGITPQTADKIQEVVSALGE